MIAFDEMLRARLAVNLSAHPRRQRPLAGRRHAAVAVVVVDGDDGHDGGASFLLCRRPATMRRHAGQWALPGGRIDPGEGPLDAALRELAEELGLRLAPGNLVGWLDDYATRSGFVITPLVLWCDEDAVLHPNPEEVATVHRFGLGALRDREPRFITIPESDRPVIQVPLGDDLIHAPTGAILHQFRQVALKGRIGERVDHLEQPVFAWK